MKIGQTFRYKLDPYRRLWTINAINENEIEGIYFEDKYSEKVISRMFNLQSIGLDDIENQNIVRANIVIKKEVVLSSDEGNSPIMNIDSYDKTKNLVKCTWGNGKFYDWFHPDVLVDYVKPEDLDWWVNM